MEIRMMRQPWSWGNNIDIRIFDEKSHSAARSIVFEEIAKGERIPVVWEIDDNAAQKMMDSLWDCGIRPSEGTGSAGAMAATQKHLEDMRTLVFKPPKVN